MPTAAADLRRRRLLRPSCLLLVALLFSFKSTCNGDAAFDVRQHLSTVTRYESGRAATAAAIAAPPPVPDGCAALHLNLLARHGTRSPTKDHIRELKELERRFDGLLREAKAGATKDVPSWMQGWRSPWQLEEKGGELDPKGEEEHYNLGLRLKQRFPELFGDDYHPDRYPITATQVPRTSASAVAFGLGLFGERGGIGPGRNRAFSVVTESRTNDVQLRFFENCGSYKEYTRSEKPEIQKVKEPVLGDIASALLSRHKLSFTKQDVASLWFLCKQEASLMDKTDQACALFTPEEVQLLEWADDTEFFLLKGCGQAINYRMGVSLLKDIAQSMENAMAAAEGNQISEKARLRFAHAETLAPLTCLLGLFLGDSEMQKIQRGEALSAAPQPPEDRTWRGSMVSPFAGNTMLVLYRCPASKKKNPSKYSVQILHNEAPVPVPGCDGKYFCPWDTFKEKIVEPHLKQDFDETCRPKRPVLDHQPKAYEERKTEL